MGGRERTGVDPLAAGLRPALATVAAAPTLLVASDYDGVLAPIGLDPAQAFPLPEATAALRRLAELPDTAVAVVSGRARADLMALTDFPEQVHLVGGHGAEFSDRLPLTPEQAALRERLAAALPELVAGQPGVWVEEKPASLVVHTRPASAEVGAAVRDAVSAGPGSWPGVRLGTGKEIVELSVVETHKGTALSTLRARTGADAVVFLGDDVTDENAFAQLRDGDVGVRVGPGTTGAEFQVADLAAGVQVLETLARLRAGDPPQ